MDKMKLLQLQYEDLRRKGGRSSASEIENQPKPLHFAQERLVHLDNMSDSFSPNSMPNQPHNFDLTPRCTSCG